MKILHVAEIVKGGVATVVNQLIESQEIENTVKIIMPSSQKTEIKVKGNASLITFNSKKRGLISHFNLLTKFISQLIKIKPDVIHIHSSFAGLICRIPLFFIPFRKFKVIYCPHAFSFMMDSKAHKKKFYVFVEKLLSKVTDSIVCVSENEYQEALKSGLSESKLVTIYNGVKDQGFIERNNWLDKNKLNVLFVGRFERQKGYDILERVISHFNDNPQLYFHIVGDYVDRGNKGYINTPNAKTYGWLSHEEVLSLYKKTDVLFMPSRWEGLPMAALEALSSGLPIIASDCSAFPELIEQDVNGLLFRTGDVEGIIYSLNYLLNCPDIKTKMSAMSLASRDKYLKQYESKKMLDETFKLYN